MRKYAIRRIGEICCCSQRSPILLPNLRVKEQIQINQKTIQISKKADTSPPESRQESKNRYKSAKEQAESAE